MIKLSEPQVEAMRQAFKFFDYDEDDKVFSSDIGVVVRAARLMPRDDEIAKIRKTVDDQYGGNVDLQTLVQLVCQECTHPEKMRPEDAASMFAMFDEERRGTLPLETVRHLLQNVGERMSEQETEDLFRMTQCVDRGAINYDRMVRAALPK